MSTEQNNVSTYKITFLGTQSVGKTSLITQYIYHNAPSPQSTVGIDYFIKPLIFPVHSSSTTSLNKNESKSEIGKSVNIKLKICDTAGQERFNAMISSYTRDSFLTCVVFDLAEKKTLDDIDRWIRMAETGNSTKKTKILIIGNKTDLIENYEGRTELQDSYGKSDNKESLEQTLEEINIEKEIGNLNIDLPMEEKIETSENCKNMAYLKEVRESIKIFCKKYNALYCETSALDFSKISELDDMMKKIIEQDLVKNNYYIGRSQADMEVFEMDRVKSRRWCFF